MVKDPAGVLFSVGITLDGRGDIQVSSAFLECRNIIEHRVDIEKVRSVTDSNVTEVREGGSFHTSGFGFEG